MPSYAHPYHAGRHPFQTYLLAVLGLAGSPLIFGQVVSGTIEDSLPPWAAFGWGLGLVVGCTCALMGAYWPVRFSTMGRDVVVALTLERVGLAIVSPAALVYACIIIIYSGSGGLLISAVVAGFGWAARRRKRDVARVFARALADRESGS